MMRGAYQREHGELETAGLPNEYHPQNRPWLYIQSGALQDIAFYLAGSLVMWIAA
jgi:hypothetical protein